MNESKFKARLKNKKQAFCHAKALAGYSFGVHTY